MWALRSNGGYLHSFNIYMGKKENEAIDTVPNIGLGGNVVLNLIAKQICHQTIITYYFLTTILQIFPSWKN